MIKTRLERLFDVLPKFYIKLININVLAMFLKKCFSLSLTVIIFGFWFNVLPKFYIFFFF